MSEPAVRGRIEAIDILRGLSILLMVAYHLGYDLQQAGLLSAELLYHPVIEWLQTAFSLLFILISGISSSFSRNNLKRGAIILAAGLAVGLVTWAYNPYLYVRFGILHFLGAAIIITHFAAPLLTRIPRWLLLCGSALCCALTWQLPHMSFEAEHLWMLGFKSAGFASSDYFPLLPYIFVFIFGTALGPPLREGRFPAFVYRLRCRPLAAAGRHTLWIYLVHQPLCMAVVAAVQYVM